LIDYPGDSRYMSHLNWTYDNSAERFGHHNPHPSPCPQCCHTFSNRNRRWPKSRNSTPEFFVDALNQLHQTNGQTNGSNGQPMVKHNNKWIIIPTLNSNNNNNNNNNCLNSCNNNNINNNNRNCNQNNSHLNTSNNQTQIFSFDVTLQLIWHSWQ